MNLAALLIPDMDISKAPENIDAFELLKHQQRDHHLDRPLSITQYYIIDQTYTGNYMDLKGSFNQVMFIAYLDNRAAMPNITCN